MRLRTALAAACLALAPGAAYAANIDTFTAGTALPQALAQMVVTTGIDGKIYIFGGYIAGGTEVATSRVYDPLADTYTTLAAMPVATRGGCGATLADGRIAMYGGTSVSDALYLYNPVNDQWATGPDVPQSQGWECAAVVSDDGKLHIFGGEDGASNYSIFDPVANTWAIGTAMPNSRVEHGASFIDGKFYVYGGSSSLTTLDIYDPVADTWTAGATLPSSGNTQFGFASDGLQLFVLGGSTEYGNHGAPFFDSIWVYDPGADAWTVNTTVLATAVRESYAVIAGGDLHVFGGSTGTQVAIHQVAPLDSDEDGVNNDADNCVLDGNAGQQDADSDGAGDVCDVCPMDADDDIDADTVCGDADNCPNIANPTQTDGDSDGLGDPCDSCPLDADDDGDADGVCGDEDNCPMDANPGQEDADNDGVGDACDDPGAGGAGGMGSGGDVGTGGDPGTGGNMGTGGSGNDDDTVVDDGCGCRVVGAAPRQSGWALLALLGVGIVSRRRRAWRA